MTNNGDSEARARVGVVLRAERRLWAPRGQCTQPGGRAATSTESRAVKPSDKRQREMRDDEREPLLFQKEAEEKPMIARS